MYTLLAKFRFDTAENEPCDGAARRVLAARQGGSAPSERRSCTLRTKPLLDYEAWSTKETFSVRERTILNALQTLVVVEDFCLPAECDLVESDRSALLFAFSERYL